MNQEVQLPGSNNPTNLTNYISMDIANLSTTISCLTQVIISFAQTFVHKYILILFTLNNYFICY